MKYVYALLLMACVIQVCCGLDTYLLATRTFDYFTSSGYPFSYDSYSDESWYLSTTNASDVINLVVVDSDIEYSSTCVYDYVQVHDGTSASSPLLKQFCGTTSPSLISTGTHLHVFFHTDSSVQRSGFRIKYWSSTKPPPSTLSNQDSLIISVSVAGSSIVIISLLALIYYCTTKKTRPQSRVAPTNVQPIYYRRNLRGPRNPFHYHYPTPRSPNAVNGNFTYYNNPCEALPDYRSLFPITPPPLYSELETRAAP